MIKTHSHEEERRFLIAAARLASEGKEQTAIAETLSISQPKVSRLLREAVEKRVLAHSPSFIGEGVTPEEIADADDFFFGQTQVRDVLRKIAPPAVHFDARQIKGEAGDFVQMATTRLISLLAGSRVVGLMWGKTMAALVDSIGARPQAASRKRISHLKCIPLCGDPVHLMNQLEVEHSASHLASELEAVLCGGRLPELPCLTGVPAYVPPALLKNALFEKYLLSIPGYREIFGGFQRDAPRALVDEVDTIISGVGVVVTDPDRAHHETGAFIRERLFQEDSLKKAELSKWILGDIGGVLVERSARDAAKVRALNEGWTGVREHHLKRVAKEAAPGNAPGVIVIAKGKAKADLIIEIIRRGYVNEIIVDEELANEIVRLKPSK